MSKPFEVFYTYCVDASMVVEAESPEEAEKAVERVWRSGDCTTEKLIDFSDFEVLNTKRPAYIKKVRE